MRIGYRKILRDVWRSKGRTLLAVLSIAIGVFALGTVGGLSEILPARMIESYRATNPAHVNVSLNGTVSNEDVARLAELPGVFAIEGVRYFGARWQAGPDIAPRNISFGVRSSYTQQKLNTLRLIAGKWPSGEGVVLEQGAAALFHADVNGSITVLINNRPRDFKVVGVIEDLSVTPIAFGGSPLIYIAPQLAENVFGARGYARLRVQVPNYSEASAQNVIDELKAQLAKIGAPLFSFSFSPPDKHWAQETVDGVILIIGSMAVLSVLLGLFLIVNTVNAIVAQQVPQIGVIKAVGGSTRQLLALYLSIALIYGFLSVLIAVPLGAWLANDITVTLLKTFVIPPSPDFQFSANAIVQQIGIGLGAPVLAAVWPIYSGVRLTVREAISSYGLDTTFGRSGFDRLLSRLRFLPRTASLILRNTFRRKGRVVLTQLTLVMAGVVFMMVMSSAASFTYTINAMTDSLGLKVLINFQRPVRNEELIAVAQTVPNIDQIETQIFQGSTAFKRSADEKGADIFVGAVRPETTLMHLPILSGRWLLPTDGHAVVMNRDRAEELGVTVGDKVWFNLESGSPKLEWTIVGIVFDLSNNQRGVYMPIEVYRHETGLIGRSTSLWASTRPDDGATQREVERQLREAFNLRGLPIANTRTADLIHTDSENRFSIITQMLIIMSSLIAAVGAIGLAGTLSINVLERRREIGVLRAIGASSFTIAGIFIGEGLVLGLIAWLLAMPLSVPIGQIFSQAIAQTIDFTIVYQFAGHGALLWLAIMIVLSIAGSALPALRATRVSVRESLAYE
jgi:putative ABC transport system permease protein